MIRHRKRTLAALILAAIILAGIAVTGVYIYAKHSGIKLEAGTDYMIDNVVYYYQKDSRWKDDPLGTSQYHMGDSGCLVCCLAAEINMQQIEIDGFNTELDPKTLNSFFSQNNVYDSEGNIQWAVLENAIGKNVVLKDASELENNEIQKLIESGCFPVVMVKMPKSGSLHFVLIVSCKDGDFICMDPMNKDLKPVPLSYFNNTIYSVRYIQN